MENHFSRYSKIALSVLVIILSLSLSFTTVYGQGLKGQGSLRERLVEKGIDLNQLRERVREVMRAQHRYKDMLMEKSGVVGTGTGITPEGEVVVKVFAARAGIQGIPAVLDGIAVRTKVTGRFYALRGETCESSQDHVCANWERWPLPVPMGVSIGHPAITAGTFGARVTDGTDVFILSNNHVLANVNQANIGDSILQPGSYDGGVNSDDAVANLSDFEPINFCRIMWIWLICDQGTNTIDAAIATSTTGEIGYETPMGQYGSAVGYGAPSSIIHAAYGDPDVIGDEDLTLLLGQSVQKYGRTTGNTVGIVDAINATVNVCYDDSCSKVAQFVDQMIITPGSFSAGGDSGSLIVTNDAQRNPVGLLFAGSDTDTIANRIDLVLNKFGVSVDGGVVAPVTDVAITNVSAPTSVVQGAVVNVEVTVENTGNQDVGGFEITLTDATAALEIGREMVNDGLSAGASMNVDISWNVPLEAALGEHHLLASHDLGDDESTNNQGTTSATVVASLTDVAVTAVSAPASVVQGSSGNSVDVTVKNMGNQDVGIFNVTLSDETAASEIATETVSDGLNAGGSTILTFSWNVPSDASLVEHQLLALHNLSDDVESNDSKATTVEVIAEPISGPNLQTGTVEAWTDRWTLVTLSHSYTDMVVVCTPNYDKTVYPSAVHIRNASGNSFEVRLVPAVFGLSDLEPPWSATVHWMVVESGTYTLEEHGVKMEAVTFDSTVTDGSSSWGKKGSWIGEESFYSNSYTNPVVVGQVITYNENRDYYWSVFWSRGPSSSDPPSSTELWVGKHNAQDARPVNDEKIGYVVIEAGQGTISSTAGPIKYKAGLGSDSIKGMGDKPPYSYSLDGLAFTPSTAILSQAAMDGGDGGWAVLYGINPVTSNRLNLAIEEDWVWDSERRHTPEQVGYIVFE